MGGSYIQLLSIGAQNIYLTGNPQITFFKMIYKRYTNFAIETFEDKTIGKVDYGSKFSIIVSKRGDLISKSYLKVLFEQDFSQGNSLIYETGHLLIKSIEIRIGDQVIDKHYGSWLSIWKQLTTTQSHQNGYDELLGGGSNITTEHEYHRILIPLQFWFCRYTGLALPLIALQYHDVKFVIELNLSTDVFNSEPNILDFSLLNNYIILDTDERRKMATQQHEYLIEQLQYQQDTLDSTINEVPIKFIYPIKELIWTYQFSGKQHLLDFSTGDETTSPLSTAVLEINGVDRFIERNGRYFSEIQPYQHHTNIPEVPGIYVYSFALNPEKHQPSGSLNFMRLNDVKLNFSLIDSVSNQSKVLTIYGINYNILKIMSGMGGISYN